MSSVVEALASYEQVLVGNDPAVGLRAIVAIHSTALGPALGGTRFVAYADEDAALADVLHLARAMTYKNALAGLPHGGGKAVIVGDPRTDKTAEKLLAYGRLVASLQGRYVTACDVGTYVADMDVIATVNPWTTGRSPEHGGAGDSGDLTAVGVHASLQAVAEHLWGAPSLAGHRVGIVGVGKVGGRLAGHVLAEGGRVLAADTDADAVARLRSAHPDVEVAASPDDVVLADVDVLSPCALGGIITADVVAALQAAAVCGGANNQLADESLATALADRGVVYAPDFLVNAGGVIAVGAEYAGRGTYDDAAARARARGIGTTLLDVLRRAEAEGATPLAAAERLAEERIAAAPPRPSFAPPSS
ncbi:MAG TPA: Glu/Leu/Phe/Val dehydrogenase dimerization domain-containing protein [Candidatus Nanopelagicales bacterium]|nr:Glu/Leu/Phe/Val dehydrogenase dimerization domain-containing protein [Candidatus Nanopelagicales bacterium]